MVSYRAATSPAAVGRCEQVEPTVRPLNLPAMHRKTSTCARAATVQVCPPARLRISMAVFLWTTLGIGAVVFAQTGPLINA